MVKRKREGDQELIGSLCRACAELVQESLKTK
jgi:hypothetical protein